MDDFTFMQAIVNDFAAGQLAIAPKIVRERCDFCGGSGLREIGKGPLATLDNCAACNAKGYINTER